MTRFTDELLSAYLDGEVTTEERATVEAQLAASEADRRLLEELQALRGEFQSLPKAAVAEGFADRVVRAAVAAKAREENSITPAASPKRSLRWVYWATAVAASLAICAVIAFRNWPAGSNNVVVVPSTGGPTLLAGPSLAERLIAELHLAAPAEGEAVVLRLQVSKSAPLGQALDVALAEAGLAQRPAFDVGSGAIQLGAAYRQKLGTKSPADLVAVSDALFVDASLQQLEDALKIVAADGQRMLNLATEARLALADLPKIERGEGEPGSEDQGHPFAQHLNAGLFRLEKRAAAAAIPAAVPATIDRQRSVKILILIEQVE